MKLYGSLIKNLQTATRSAGPLKGHPVHKDTLAFWAELVAHGRAEVRTRPASETTQVEALLAILQEELTARQRS